MDLKGREPSISQIREIQKDLLGLHWCKSAIEMIERICNMAVELRAVHAENAKLRREAIWLRMELEDKATPTPCPSCIAKEEGWNTGSVIDSIEEVRP